MLDASPQVESIAYQTIGAAIEVHRHLGPGLLESTYGAALAIELDLRRIPFEEQVEQLVLYKEHPIATARMDLLVAGMLVVELKAVEAVSSVHVAQTVAYLAITGLELGLVINFNVGALKDGVRRVIRSNDPHKAFAASRLRVNSDRAR